MTHDYDRTRDQERIQPKVRQAGKAYRDALAALDEAATALATQLENLADVGGVDRAEAERVARVATQARRWVKELPRTFSKDRLY